MAVETSTQISIYTGDEWYYTVEDQNIVVDTDGCTISYWEKGNRKIHITMEPEEALAVADAIYKLFKKTI
jgi:hypothetical protein